MKQTTLQGEFTLEGKGLHTGARLVATFCPIITDTKSSVSTLTVNP